MAFEDVLLGLELGILSVIPLFMALLGWLFYRWSKRHHVWADIELADRIVRPKVLPKGGMLMTKYGSWKIDAPAKPFKNRSLYRCVSGYPYTVAWDRQKLLVEIEVEKKDKDGKVSTVKKQEWQTVVNPLPSGPSEGRISTHLKDHHFADAYSGKAGLTFLMLIIAFLVVVSILIQVVK